MSVIYRSDLNSDKAISMLNSDIADADKLINAINNFVDNSKNTLKGEAWDIEREKFSNYIIVLEKRKNAAGALKNSIDAANQIMRNYLDEKGVDKVDTAELDYLRNEYQQACVNYNAAEKDEKNTSENYWYGELQRLYELIAYIKNLPSVDGNAYAKYGDASAAIEGFASSIGNV